MKTNTVKRMVLALIFSLNLNLITLSQSPNGVLSGSVMDQQKAIISNVQIIMTNTATNFKYTAISDNEGRYSFVSLPPSKYKLSATRDGYKNIDIDITISVALQEEYDIEMILSTVKEDMNIKGGSAVSPTTMAVCCDQGAARGTNITREQIVGLPTITRNVFELVSLAPGTTPTSEGRGIGIASNGQRSSSGSYVLDGGDNNDVFLARPSQTIPPDSIQEFRVLTNQYTAEYGRNAGFIANVVSSQGTNDFHLSAFLFNRNSALAAHTFDENANGFPKGTFNRNQFGGTIGGPIKKDKAFFFFAAEPTKIRSHSTRQFFVPTPDFLRISSPLTKAIFSRFTLPSDISSVVSTSLVPFGGTASQNIPAFGLVSRQGPADAGAGAPQDGFSATSRFDYAITDKMQLYGRYSVSDNDFFAPVSQPYDPKLDQESLFRAHGFLLNLVRIWSSNLVMETRINYNRQTDEQKATAQVGSNYFPILLSLINPITLPSASEGTGGVENVYQFYSSTSWNKGDHLFKFGGQYIHIRDNRIIPGTSQLATLIFLDLQSLIDGFAFYQLSFDPKGKLLGETVPGPFTPPAIKHHFRYNEFSFFAQDTWKVSQRVTLSPGLRWEYFGVPHSPDNEKNLDANFYYGQGATVFDRIANGKFLRTSDAPGKYKDHLYLPDYNNFAPRLGIAWDVFGNGKTIVRSGAGMFYDRNFGNVLQNVGRNLPAYAQQLFLGSFTPNILSDPFAFTVSGITLNNVSGRQLDQNLKTAYSVSWNAGIEQLLRSNLLVGITYVGSSGVKLYSLSDINRVNSGTHLGRPPSLDPFTDDNRLVANTAELNTRSNLGHSSYHSLQLRLDTGYIKNLGLQVGANYTYSHSIDNSSSEFSDDFLANRGTLGFLDAFNPSLDRGDSDFDVRHRFVANFVWDLPFGLKSDKWFVRNVLAGWGVSGVFTFQTGQPFSIYDFGNGDAIDSTTRARPKFSGTLPGTTLTPIPGAPNTYLYLPLNFPFRDPNNPKNCISSGPFYCSAAFGEPYDGTISRNIFRRPGTQYHNLAISRSFALPKIFGREGVKFQLRGELYDLFNHANLYVNPITNDVALGSFIDAKGNLSPGVTVRRGFSTIGSPSTFGLPSFIDNRQVVIVAKFIF